MDYESSHLYQDLGVLLYRTRYYRHPTPAHPAIHDEQMDHFEMGADNPLRFQKDTHNDNYTQQPQIFVFVRRWEVACRFCNMDWSYNKSPVYTAP